MRRRGQVTVYLDARTHRALRMKAGDLDRSVSDVVNEAVRQALIEDSWDGLDSIVREKEHAHDFTKFVKSLKRRGKL